MRGEFCILGASVFTFLASVIMVFSMVGQINTTTLPRGISMIQIRTTGLQTALTAARSGVSFSNVTVPNNAPVALGSGSGVYNSYRYGLLSHCGYTPNNSGRCNSTRFGLHFEPFQNIQADVPTAFRADFRSLVNNAATFRNTNYTGRFTVAGFWLLFIGSCSALLAFIFGVIPHRFTFLIAAFWATIATIGLGAGAAIWTAIFVRVRNSLAGAMVNATTSVGISAQFGVGLGLAWGAFLLAALSIGPYVLACCTYERY